MNAEKLPDLVPMVILNSEKSPNADPAQKPAPIPIIIRLVSGTQVLLGRQPWYVSPRYP